MVAVSTIAAVRSAFLSLIVSQSLGTNRSSVESVNAPPARCTCRVSRPSVSRSIGQRPNDDQPVRAAVPLPGRPGPLAGRGEPVGAHLGQRRRALLLLGQRVLRLLLRRGVLASLPLAVDGGLLLRLVRGLLGPEWTSWPGPWSPWRRCRRTAPARRLRRPRTAARRRPPPRARHPATPHGHPDVPLPVFASPHPFAIRPHLDRTRLRGMTAGALTRLSECAAHYTAQRELTCRRVGPSAPYRRVRARPRDTPDTLRDCDWIMPSVGSGRLLLDVGAGRLLDRRELALPSFLRAFTFGPACGASHAYQAGHQLPGTDSAASNQASGSSRGRRR